jgi:hypothetical protein
MMFFCESALEAQRALPLADCSGCLLLAAAAAVTRQI